MAKNEVRIHITGDATALGGALNAAEGKLAAFSNKMRAVGTKLRSVGQSMTLGLTLPIVGALGLGVKWAGELEDAQAASEQVFGSMSKQMDKWADNAAKNFGLSKGEAQEWANQVGIRLRSIGNMTEQEAANWSQTLVQLGGDFASFFGGTTAEAVQAINSALTGEFEPLKRYGVIINDQTLKAKIFKDTGEEVTGTLTAQQKQLATLGIIMEETGLVQGDYARNAEGATNAQRTMTASLKDAATELGNVLLPYVTQAVQWITNLVDKFKELDPNMQRIIVIAAVVVAALGPLIYILGVLATAISFIASPVGLVIAALVALGAAIWWLYNNNDGFRRWVDDVIDWFQEKIPQAIDYFTDTIWPKLVDAWEWIRDEAWPMLKDAAGKIRTAWDWIWDKVAAFIGWWKENVWPITEEVIGLIVAGHRFMVNEVLPKWAIIQSKIENVLNFLRPFIDAFLRGTLAIWSVIWSSTVAVVSFAWNLIRGKVETGLAFIRALFNVAGALLSGAWRNVWNLVYGVTAGKIGEIVGYVRRLPGMILGALGNIGGILVNAGRSIMNGLLSGLRSAWAAVKSFVSGIAGTIASIKGPLDYDAKLLVPAGNAIMDGLGVGLAQGMRDIESMMSNVAPSLSATVATTTPAAPAATATRPTTVGNTYNVTVNAGMGTDGAEVGREVVDAIRSYERFNGAGWRN